MAGVPMVVTYRLNPLTAAIARRLVTVQLRFAGQSAGAARGDAGTDPGGMHAGSSGGAVRSLLDDPAVAAAQRAACRDVLGSLRPPAGMPSDAAAAAVLDVLDQP